MELLVALEQFAALKVATSGSPEILQQIVDVHAEMSAAAAAGDVDRYYRLNDDFHRQIVLGCGNRNLADAHERIMWHVYRARIAANKQETLSRDAADHHKEIVEALLRGDGEAAGRAVRNHFAYVIKVISGQ